MKRALLVAVLLLVGVPLMAAAALLYTEAGLRFALGQLAARSGLISFEAPRGVLAGPLRVARLVYDDGTLRIEAREAALEWVPAAALRGRLHLRALAARELTVRRRPRPDAPAPAPDAAALTELPFALVAGEVTIGRLALDLSAETEPIELREVALAGWWVGPRVEIERLALVAPRFGALQLSAGGELAPQHLELRALQLDALGARLTLDGRLAWAGESALRLAWERLRWPLQGAPQLESARGLLDWRGRFDDYRFEATAALAAQGLATELRASGSGTRAGLAITALQAPLLGGAVQAQGRVDWSPALAITADARLQQIDPAALAPAFGGRLSGRLQAQSGASLDHWQLGLTLADSELRGYALAGALRARWDAGVARIEALDLQSGDSTRLRAEGRAWPTLDLEATLASRDLAALAPQLGGAGELRVRAHGPLRTPRLVVAARAAPLQAAGLTAQQATLDGTLDLAGETRAALRLSDLRVGATPLARIEADLDGRIGAHRLQLRLDGPRGAARVELRGAAAPQAPRWFGTLTAAQLAPRALAPWSLAAPAALEATRDGVLLRPACWRSDGARACVTLDRAAGEQQLRVELQEFALALLQPVLPPDWSIDGTLSGRAGLAYGTRGLHALALDLTSSAGEIARGGRRVLAFEPGQARVAEAGDELQATLQLPFEQGRLALDARLAARGEWPQRGLAGTLRLEVPRIEWLQLISPEIESAQGRIEGALTLSGTLGTPRFAGALALRDGRARLGTPAITLEDVQAELHGTSEAAGLALRGRARSGEGTLTLEGQLRPGEVPLIADLRLRGENFQAMARPDLQAWVSPELEIRGDADGLVLSGTLRVPRADIRPVSFDRGLAPSPDQVIVDDRGAAAGGSAVPLQSRVRIELGEAVHFAGFGLSTRLAGALDVEDGPGRPTSGRGQIELLGGKYKAYGQELTIETGRLIFGGGAVTDPAIEIRAQRKPREDVTVGVYVRGQLDAPEFTLFSTPAMPQENQLSWLVLGRPLESTAGSQDRSLLAGAALSLGLSGSDYLANRLRGNLGLDEISIGSRPGDAADTAKLTLGKYLSPRIFISYGVGLFQPGNLFRLRYDIGRGFKLQTESGTESGGDLLYTVERD